MCSVALEQANYEQLWPTCRQQGGAVRAEGGGGQVARGVTEANLTVMAEKINEELGDAYVPQGRF